MLTNHVLGLSQFSYTDFTRSPFLRQYRVRGNADADQTVSLVERLKKNPIQLPSRSAQAGQRESSALQWCGRGIDPRKLKIVIYKASIDATTA